MPVDVRFRQKEEAVEFLSSNFSNETANPVFDGDLRAKFYATNPTNGTPGTYTTAAPVGGEYGMEEAINNNR